MFQGLTKAKLRPSRPNQYLGGLRIFENMIGNWPTDQGVTSSITWNKWWVASGWWSKPTSVARDPPVVVEIHSSTSSRPVATRQQRLEDPNNSSRARLELSQAENMNKKLFQWRKDNWRGNLSPEGTEPTYVILSHGVLLSGRLASISIKNWCSIFST